MVASDESLFTADEWDACNAEPEIAPGDRVVLGLDASVSHDCSSVCVVKRVGDVYHATWKIWAPTKRNEVQLSDLEQHVRELAQRYRVEALVYDRFYATQLAQNLRDEGVNALEWQYSRMPNAVVVLKEVVAHRRLRHGGDEAARSHALAAELVEREHGAIITKRKTKEPNDAVVALGMALEFSTGLKPAPQSIYESR